MSRYFVKYNANPFGKTDDSDCAIRSTSQGLGIPYREVCRILGVAFQDGRGLARDTGIDLYDLQKKFKAYFSNVENYDSESYERPAEFGDFKDPFYDDGDFDDNTDSNLTLNDWMETFEGTGRYLVGCVNSRRADGHIVLVDTNKMEFYDTWDCGRCNVDSYMRIKNTVKESGVGRHPLVKVAIIVHNKPNRYLDRIMSGEKRMETRCLSKGKEIMNLMKRYGDIRGQGIALIDDNHMIVGWGEVEDIKLYANADEFYADQHLHGISPGDEYGYDEKKGKAGILFRGKPHRLSTPIPVDPAIRQRRGGYVNTTGYEEDDIYRVIMTDESP